jgi:hypothetical protein
MQQGTNLRFVVDPKRLRCTKRQDVVNNYFNWRLTIAREFFKYQALLGLGAVILVGGVVFNKWLLVFLVPLLPFVLRAQFNYEDAAGDLKRWKNKRVTRIDTEKDYTIDQEVLKW